MQINDASMVLELDRIPPSVNHAYIVRRTKTGVMRIRTAKFKEFQEYVHSLFPKTYRELQNDGKTVLEKEVVPMKSRLGASITICYGDERQRDLDNSLKVIFDSLEGKAFENDNQIDYIEIRRVKGEAPKIKIRIYDLFGTFGKKVKCSTCGRMFDKDELSEKYKREGKMVVYVGHVCKWCF